MIIIEFMGGLGNQMFQYALYKKLELLGKDVYADLRWYDNIKNVKFSLGELGIHLQCASDKDIFKLSDKQMDFLHRIRRRILGVKKSYVVEKNDSYFMSDILKVDDVYLRGYWQTEKYFEDIREALYKDFRFKLNDKKVKIWKEKIEMTNSISIHIRRKDYLAPQFFEMYGNICTDMYYKKAINYMKKQVEKATFYVFTDDIEWAEKNPLLSEYTIVKNTDNDDTIADMYLMSLCKHNIIANSSYSWWAAWLNRNLHKVVIAPNKWLNGMDTPYIWCEGWMRI